VSAITHVAGNRLQRISTAPAKRPTSQAISEKLTSGIRGSGAVAMKHASSEASANTEGFLLLNSGLSPIFVNRAAAEILSYPHKLEAHKNLDDYLASRVRASLVSGEPSRAPKLVSEFQSGRRLYHCRAYRVTGLGQGDSECSYAIILERGSNGSFSMAQVSERFHLTVREREVLQYLLNGLTTKEIASGMEISPNTVKAFLRMIMVKMGVSTRSAIVGKAFTGKL
jgi:DNA-binding CsgD family transcriptional regulator